MKKIKLIFIIYFLILIKINAQNQDAENIINRVSNPTPVSPQIAAFQQYGDVNVNLSTGVPNISIPLLEIKHYDYKLPISLDYFPTPIKPGYNYDVTGIGWNLSLRSNITRKVNYLPDEHPDANFVVYDLGDMDFTVNFYVGLLDEKNFASDVFNVSLPDGSSFKFYIQSESETSDPEVFILNGRPLKVTWEESGNSLEGIISFKITDESGIVYSFNQTNYRFTNKQEIYHTEWHLTGIKLPQYTEEIRFWYSDAVKATHTARIGGYLWERSPTESKISDTNGTTSLDHGIMLLSSIQYAGGNINFKYKEDPPQNLLDLKQKSNFYNYLDVIEHGGTCNFEDYIVFNRKIETVNNVDIAQLEAIEFKEGGDSCENNDVIKRYVFENDEISVRPRTDHWGYCNSNGHTSIKGVSNFVFYSPEPHEKFSNSDQLTKVANGYDSDVNIKQYAKYQFNAGNASAGRPGGNHGILKSIIYPTKGKTIFEFERHKFLTKSGADGEFIFNEKEREIAESSGFRIRSIKNVDSNGVEINTKSYRYGKRASEIWDVSDDSDMLGSESIVDEFMKNKGKKPESHTDVGVVVVDPTILNFLDYQVVFPENEPVLTQPTTIKKFLGFIKIRNKFWYDGYRRCFKCDALTIVTPPEIVNRNYLRVVLGTKFSKFYYTDPNKRYHANVSISASNFQRTLDGRPQVVYPYVTVYEGDYDDDNPSSTSNIKGKTEFVYDFMDEHDDYPGVKFFMEPVIIRDYTEDETGAKSEIGLPYYESKSHRYNKLLEKKDYKVFTSNSYKLIREEFSLWGHSSFVSVDLFHTFKAPFPLSYLNSPSTTHAKQIRIYEYINFGTNNNIYQKYFDPKLISKTVINHYDDDIKLTTNQNWFYIPGGMLSEQDITNSQGETKKTTYKYATNFEDKNILNLPTNMLTYFDDGLDEQSNKFKYRLLSGAKVDYDDLGRPEKTYTATLNGSETSLCSSNNPCSYKEEAVYYYNNEVLTQITSSEGSSTVFLWNSLRQLIIAKIENATYNQVQSYDGADLSDSKTLYNEIKTSLSDDVLITTYSYNGSSRNPSEITDPRGYTTYYEYDEAQRLKYIKDEEGNILSKNEYNYKN